jgi:hypothetical protein
MFDPELYLSEYEIKDPKTGQNLILTSQYRDATGCAEDDIIFDSDATKNKERLSYFCVSIPGEAPWVTEAYRSQATCPQTPSVSNFSREKRTRDDEDDNDQVNQFFLPN